MNWFDVLLLIILAGSVASSLRKGLTREIVGLVSVILALLFGTWFYGTVGGYLLPYVSSPSIAKFAGFVLVFVAVMMLGGVVSAVLGRVLKLTGLSILDHLMGAAFGLLRGIIVAVALVMAAMAFSPGGHPPAAVVGSTVSPYVVDAARACASLAPYELKQGFRKTYDQVKAAWAKAMKERPRDNRETGKAQT